jgi:hypothetical protein
MSGARTAGLGQAALRLSRRPLRWLIRMTSLLNAIISLRPKERPAGTRLEGRTARVPSVCSRVLILFLVALALAGCGKKGNPQPPPGEPDTYPRTYPSA